MNKARIWGDGLASLSMPRYAPPITVETLKQIGIFIWAVVSVFQAYVTGGVVITALFLYERIRKQPISMRIFVWGVYFFLVVAIFMAWREQYVSVAVGIKN